MNKTVSKLSFSKVFHDSRDCNKSSNAVCLGTYKYAAVLKARSRPSAYEHSIASATVAPHDAAHCFVAQHRLRATALRLMSSKTVDLRLSLAVVR